MNRNDDLLRTDAYGITLDNMHIGRIHIDAADATVADNDAIKAAIKRVKTTAWVASSATVTNSLDDTMVISAPAMMGATPNADIEFLIATATDDTLAVAAGTGETVDTITITVAQTTATKNTAALIQAAIRALGTVNGIDVSGFICTVPAGSDWDTATVAKENDTAVALASGVTGTIDTYTTDLGAPPQARNITATSAGTAGDIANVAVTVYGTDIGGLPISEELPYFTANSGTTVTGSKAFKTITRVDIPSADGANATVSIGYGNAFGLPILMTNKMALVAFDGVFEDDDYFTMTIDSDELCNNTIDIHGTLDGAKPVDILLFL